MNRTKLFKKIVLFLATLVTIAFVLLFTLDLGFLRGTVENQVRQATGRDFSINRGLSISLGRELVIRAQDVHIGNPEWADQETFAHAFNVHAVIDTWSLWKGPLVIRQLEVNDLTVLLVQNEQGQANWVFVDTDQAQEKPPEQLPFLIENVTVREGYIDFNSPRLDQPIRAVIDLLEESVGSDGQIHANIAGSLNDRPMQVELNGGPYSQLLTGDNFNLEGNGSFGNISLLGSASFDNLWQPLLPDVDVQISGPDFKELTDMLGIQGLGSGEMSLAVTSQPGDGELITRINGSLGRIKVDINAAMTSLAEATGASVWAQVSGPNFGRIARLAGFEGWPEEAFEIGTQLQRPDQALQIEQFQLLLAGTSIDLQGMIPEFPEMSGSELALRISGPDLTPFGEITGLQNLPAGAFSVAGDVMTSPAGETSLNVQYEVPLASGGIEGNIGSGEGMTGSAFRLTAQGNDASALGAILELPGLPQDPWTVLVDAALNNPAFHDLTEVKFATTGLSVDLQGRIGSDSIDKDTDLKFSLSGEHLVAFQAVVGEDMALPDQPFKLAGQATAIPGAWQLKDVSGNAGTTSFVVNGKLGQGESLAGSDLTLETSGTDLGRIFELPGEARMPDGPFTITTRIGLDESRLKISGTQVVAGPFSLKLDADLPWPLDNSQGQFSLQTNGVNITRILPELAGLELDAEDYEIIADGNWSDGKIAFSQGRARIGESTMSAQGTLDLPPNLSATDFNIEFHSPDLSQLGTVDGARWGTVPLDLTSSFAGTSTRFVMEQFEAQLGESNIEGDFTIDFEPEVPLFDLKFTTNALNLKPFQVDPVEEDSSQKPSESDGRMIPDVAFPMELLAEVEGKFEIFAERVFLKRMTLHSSTLNGEIRDGSLLIDEIATDGYQGRLVSTLTLAPGADGNARLNATMNAEELIINLTQQSSQDKEVLPAFNVDISLEATGTGLREAARALNGTLRVNSPGGQVNNTRSESVSGLFLAEVVSAISPSASKQDVINISCIAAAIDVEEGMVLLDPGIALQSDKLNLFASGKINLDSEKIDISFKTETRKAVDISASELFSPYVKLSGTLAEPSVALDPKGTLLSGGAAYLSGGLSILAKKALGQLAGTKDPCADYLATAK